MTTHESTSTGTTSSSTGGPAEDSSAAASTASTSGSSTGVLWDLGVAPDIGSAQPPGCKGKVDFLFAISREWNMQDTQQQIIASFKPFIESIQGLGDQFADFDFHIMVVDGDDDWGSSYCEEKCDEVGWCDETPAYPCMEEPTTCDRTLGAGTIYNAGDDAPNKSCGLAADKRYLDTTTWDLEQTFACIAQVGTSGSDLHLADAIDAAVTTQADACNKGFLRDDALLVITFIKRGVANGPESYPLQWYLRLVDAKGGDPNAIVMLGISAWSDLAECLDHHDDWLCALLVMFPHHVYESEEAGSYGPAFQKTVELIGDACSEFIPG